MVLYFGYLLYIKGIVWIFVIYIGYLHYILVVFNMLTVWYKEYFGIFRVFTYMKLFFMDNYCPAIATKFNHFDPKQSIYEVGQVHY